MLARAATPYDVANLQNVDLGSLVAPSNAGLSGSILMHSSTSMVLSGTLSLTMASTLLRQWKIYQISARFSANHA